MTAPDLVNLSALSDDAKCFALVRQHRWPEGVGCPGCGSASVVRDGHDDTQPQRQRYRCKACAGRFDDLTGTVLAGHHQPLRVWVLCLYFMGLNLSNRQIAQELGLDGPDVQAMAEQLRRGLVAKAPPVRLEEEKPPVLGLIQRGGQLVMRMLADVRRKTIRPIIETAVAEGARVHTDEYASYARLPAWGYRHVTVCGT